MDIKTKREEIREGLAERVHLEWCDWSLSISEKEQLSPERIERWKKYWVEYKDLPEDVKEQDRQWADTILSYLHKEGVVIKVETNVETDGFGLVGATVQRMVGAGYTLTEPLLEE